MTFAGLSVAVLLLSFGCNAASAGLANAPRLGRTPPPPRSGPAPDVISNGLDSCERATPGNPVSSPGSAPCPLNLAPQPLAAVPPPPPIQAPTVRAPPPPAWHPTICVPRSLFSDEEVSEACCGGDCTVCVADTTPCGPFRPGLERRP
jgi:hypothetical protein